LNAIRILDEHHDSKYSGDDSRSDVASLVSDDSSIFGTLSASSSVAGLGRSDSGMLSASPSGYLDFDLNDFDENTFIS
jgi:hypothetical protein